MSHRKFQEPRKGSLAFLPKKRCRHVRGHIRTFPRDDPAARPHLTAFMGFKAGMTHIVMQSKIPGSAVNNKEVVMAATVVDTPPMTVVGMVGYIETPLGMRALTTVWANFLSEDFRRRYYRRWSRSKRVAFSKYTKRVAENPRLVVEELARMKKHCSVIRVIAHTDVRSTNTGARRAHIMEIQVNGGSVPEKVNYGYSLFEKKLHMRDVFGEGEYADVIGVTKGHGFNGVVRRWGARILPRKTRRGNRKVACIGPWHPSAVSYAVARAGQRGFHHRTEMNKRILRMAHASHKTSGSTESDRTEKTINPMGGFPHYGVVHNEFALLQGCCVGPRKRVLTFRRAMHPLKQYETQIRWISTASKVGHGRFQTQDEKRRFYTRK